MGSIYTIGYSPHTRDSFLACLRKHAVTAVVDVRSVPYGIYHPEFNRETIKSFLQKQGLVYVFLGNAVGARFEDPSVYDEGRADYEKIAMHPLFRHGLERIRHGADLFSLVLMCAEKDPIDCHRAILISRSLRNEFNIKHILEDGSLESHASLENRLLQLYSLDHALLPGIVAAPSELDEAYSRHGKKIAYDRSTDEKAAANG